MRSFFCILSQQEKAHHNTTHNERTHGALLLLLLDLVYCVSLWFGHVCHTEGYNNVFVICFCPTSHDDIVTLNIYFEQIVIPFNMWSINFASFNVLLRYGRGHWSCECACQMSNNQFICGFFILFWCVGLYLWMNATIIGIHSGSIISEWDWHFICREFDFNVSIRKLIQQINNNSSNIRIDTYLTGLLNKITFWLKRKVNK